MNMYVEETIKNLYRRWLQPGRREIEAFKTWVHEHAVLLEPLDGANTDIEKLSVLDELLTHKRIIYLGEEDHWIHEKSEYRLLLLRYLFSRGYRWVGEELGWSDGSRVDRYIATGDKSHLDRIATYGYRGALRTDRDDKPTGILKDTLGRYPVREFAAEQIRIAQALCCLNENRVPESARLHFFGYDIDVLAGGGYEDIAEMLHTVKDAPEAARLQLLLARVPGETVEQEIARLSRALEYIQAQELELKKLLGERVYQLEECTRTLRDGFDFIRVANPATDWAILNSAMAAREQAMSRHVKSILDQMGPSDKLVLMGHNRHLSKDIGIIKSPGASSGGKRVPSLGDTINRLFPDQVFSIWMLLEQGLSSQPFSWLSSEYTSKPGSLNAVLAEVGETYILSTATSDPRAHLFSAEMDIVGIYNAAYRTTISKQADAIFFVRKVSPLREE
jgi:erythromycin esterase-like protein